MPEQDSEEPQATSLGSISGTAEPRGSRRNRRVVIALVVVAIFAGVFIAKLLVGNANGGSITSIHNNAVADYEAALKTGKPVYVLFHSLS